MNVASAIPTARFNALLVEGDKSLGLESTLRDEGCSVQRVSSRAAAVDALANVDVIVIGSSDLSDDDVLDVIGKANGASVLVVAANEGLAVKAAKRGATVAIGGSSELLGAQLKSLMMVVDMKKKMTRTSIAPAAYSTSPTSGVVQRRSAPLPKEATPDALQLLIESAEGLVPMHKFQRVYVDYALRRFGGNKVHTAAALGIDRRTIQRWARARADLRPTAAVPTTQSS